VVGGIVDGKGSVCGDVLCGGSMSTNAASKHTGRGLPSVAAIIIFGGERERFGGDRGGFVKAIDGE
jgi:hypothetical protein